MPEIGQAQGQAKGPTPSAWQGPASDALQAQEKVPQHLSALGERERLLQKHECNLRRKKKRELEFERPSYALKLHQQQAPAMGPALPKVAPAPSRVPHTDRRDL